MAVFGLSIISMLAIRVVVTQKEKLWDDWIQECRPGSSCYKFIDKEDIWNSAVQYCESHDWQLVEIEDFAEFQFIQEKIRVHFGMQAGKVAEFWTAGIYDLTVRQWLWYYSRKGVQANMWAPSEPNNPDNENCIGLYNNANYYLNDENCFEIHFSICEGK